MAPNHPAHHPEPDVRETWQPEKARTENGKLLWVIPAWVFSRWDSVIFVFAVFGALVWFHTQIFDYFSGKESSAMVTPNVPFDAGKIVETVSDLQVSQAAMVQAVKDETASVARLTTSVDEGFKTENARIDALMLSASRRK